VAEPPAKANTPNASAIGVIELPNSETVRAPNRRRNVRPDKAANSGLNVRIPARRAASKMLHRPNRAGPAALDTFACATEETRRMARTLVSVDDNPERLRIEAEERREEHWSLWGPYLSDRQWGTVREDYSADGDAWSYFPFEHAALRAYRWGEDGIFGICDNHQRLCLAPAFWNGNDPILKERFYGLGGHQGNHGEDVKELYYYLDNLPSHAYMRALYKYPQRAFPYAELLQVNAARSRLEDEYELIDTGIFDDDAYFEITATYAKGSPSDILVEYAILNRGKQNATLHLVTQLWYRNLWSWTEDAVRPSLSLAEGNVHAIEAHHPTLSTYRLYYEGDPELLFTENETNVAALYGLPNAQPYVKDSIGRAVVEGERDAVNPAHTGTKAGLHYSIALQAGQRAVLRFRLSDATMADPFGRTFAGTLAARAAEADRFYAAVNPFPATPEQRAVQRSAFAGMLWNKQFYDYIVRDWLRGDPTQPPPPAQRLRGRNSGWIHLYNDDVLSMPDTWEFPWYASWDLAFHTVVFALIDPHFAKRQLITLTREWYMHPNGELPAYEWAFSDVNPPVHAWAAYRVFQIEHKMYGRADYLFLERVFQKLLMNFTWWVNREDPSGDNVFEGGFLGLDNIGAFDRGAPLPAGWTLEQSDATSWMAVYSLDMMAIALELAQHDPSYEDIASKFFEHFLYIAYAINGMDASKTGLWDEQDCFFYDRLTLPNGGTFPLRVRSVVGLLPLLAVETLQPRVLARVPNFTRRLEWFIENRPELSRNVARMETTGLQGRRLLAILSPDRLRALLKTLFDENEFLSAYGIRSLSKFHEEHPYVAEYGGHDFRVDYDPGVTRSSQFGGNSNWRGPVWFPMNYLVVEALQNYHFYYGDDFKVEFPTGSGKLVTLWDAAGQLSHRLLALFTRGADGRRPFNGLQPKLQDDPNFRDLLLFNEFFHGDDGSGLGASHQTGWTGLIAKLVQQLSEYEANGKSPLDWTYDAEPDSDDLLFRT
jgi:Glycosyl hydrolase family 63 C-terminal domain